MTGRKTSRNFKPRRITERDTTSTPNDNPRLPKNWDCHENWDCQDVGITRRTTRGQRDSQYTVGITKTKNETTKLIPTILARKHEDYYKDD